MHSQMLALFLTALLPFASAQSEDAKAALPSPDPLLDAIAIQYGDRAVPAREVVEGVLAFDPGLRATLARDQSYRATYLASPQFLRQTRAYADKLGIDDLGVAQASDEQVHAETVAWIADRNSKLSPAAAIRSQGLTIQNRARLLALDTSTPSTADLRAHMLRSVAEFFGQLQIAWIRVPLFNVEEGRALGEEEVRQVYARLDEAAQRIHAGELEWKDAVEEYSQDPGTRADGAAGIVTRDMTDRYEIDMLRPLFADLGYKAIQNTLLRGPILAERWAYLVQIEAMRVDGVPEVQRARARILRSLRETSLQEQLLGIRQVRPAKVLAPIRLPS